MGYDLVTRTGRNFYEVTSAMQHGIRKGDYELAGYCLWEMIPQYTAYLRKRLLVISAEDCYGVITKEILNQCEIGDENALTNAIALLCHCKKNRDADYFVCNLMSTEQPTGDTKDELAKKLHVAIRKKKVVEAGQFAAELFQSNRKKFWAMLKETAEAFYPHLMSEVDALCESNDRMSKPAEETIFVAKAIVLMWTEREEKEQLLGWDGMKFDKLLGPEEIPVIKPIEKCKRYRMNELFPEWAYNWHTTYGKYRLRRDAVHAISNDQKILTPLEENLFDDCTWNRDINICLTKWNPKRRPTPYDDGLRNPAEKFGGL